MQALTTTSITFFLRGFSFPRSVLIGSAAIQAALLSCWNGVMLAVRSRLAKVSDAMIIGNANDSAAVANILSHMTKTEKINIKYVFEPGEKKKYNGIIKKSLVDAVFVCAGLSEDLKMEILLHCMNYRKEVFLIPEVFEIALVNADVIHLDETPVIHLDTYSLSFEQRLFKRLFDLAATLAALPLLLPFFAVIAAGVKLSSKGRVFYSQDRVTSGGRIYKIYKFRTMYEGAESLTGPVLASEGDERVTPYGGILRRYHLDELPQLINVLKGEMSLVGPRSERPYFAERFSRDINGYDIRNNVKAGLTGYAQIFGNYGTEAELKLKYDILYINNYSLLLDIKLIFQTIDTIIKGGRKRQGG